MFGCTPDIAERQHPQRVAEIAEYRAAVAAVALFNQGRQGIEKLQAQPALGRMLADLLAAQQETHTDVDAVYGLMAALPQPDDDEDGE